MSSTPELRSAPAPTPTPPAAPSIPVTVVIAARNEAENIQGCIDSVRWADEVIVADHGSSDDTADRARGAGVTVIGGAEAATIGALRNLAIETARHDWVLVVDADERGTPALGAEVARTTTASALGVPTAQAYRVPRSNFFLGAEIKHGGWERDRPVRLFRRTLRYDASRVHEHVVTSGAVGVLHEALLHYPYQTLDAYFEKFDRYSRWWAEDQFRRGRRTSVLAVVVKPPARFVSMYLFRAGFLDGARGVVLAALAAASVLAKYARLWALACES